MPTPAPAPRSPYRLLIRLLAVLIAAVLVYRYATGPTPPGEASPASDLPRLNILPPFALTERNGRNVTNHDLAGKIWVADFIYTTCPGPCPLVTASMAKLQDAVAHDFQVQLVTFTVDPETDTPAVLARYADEFGADPTHWWFLTGPEKPLYALIGNGFHLAVQDNRDQPPAPGQFTVTHSTQMALVDGGGYVRGYYEGTSAEGRANLLRDIKVLEQEEKQ